ncbi:MAG: XdhC family protein [Thermoanaerobacteraceae bacterium]|uniref:XdhC family protein n=1 Tax=Thermanaeromonas sp. C210 TaxID=2731925 RepID=UPI000E86C343|nr:XdhC family protein [Thermanaeromonas sp. C210]MBE3581947.1 XdhC family protein [Thermoanaerobacteraceae bacterium]GFN22258.1 sulfurylase small subunit, molybdopterin cytosine dinucleotide biosynthesis [Thermanaeromonas sp. C210]HBT46623.1 sulfurylase small subunit [Peptococcaceae bacterium]
MDKELVNTIVNLLEQGETFVLATIVRTKGSTPREAGSGLVVLPDGRMFGTIGGGCAEAEVRQRALEVLQDGKAGVVRVDLTAEVAEDEGMVCGGIMDVFLEPLGGKTC